MRMHATISHQKRRHDDNHIVGYHHAISPLFRRHTDYIGGIYILSVMKIKEELQNRKDL